MAMNCVFDVIKGVCAKIVFENADKVGGTLSLFALPKIRFFNFFSFF
jgi:hypothetical protein